MSREKSQGFANRLRRLLDERFEGNQTALARAAELPAGSVSSYLSGESLPSFEKIIGICEASGAATDWLLTGKGPMFREGAAPPAAAGELVPIPLYPELRVSAGEGREVHEEEADTWMAFRSDWIKRELKAAVKNLILLPVEGDSMEPTLRSGDVVMVDRTRIDPLRDGIYVVRLDNAVMVKRLQRLAGNRLRITSDNSAYEPQELSLDEEHHSFGLVGKVVWFGRQM